MQVYAAGIVYNALRVAQGEVADAAGLDRLRVLVDSGPRHDVHARALSLHPITAQFPVVLTDVDRDAARADLRTKELTRQALGGTYGLSHGAMNALCLPPALEVRILPRSSVGVEILFLSDRNGHEDIYLLESDDPEHPELVAQRLDGEELQRAGKRTG